MAKGKLSVTEKYTIQGMLHDGKSTKEIAELLSRTETIIDNYVNKELASLQETVAKAQSQAVEETVPTIEVSEEMFDEVVHKLRQAAGMLKEDATELLNRTIRKLKLEPDNSNQLYVWCIRNLNAKDVMGTRTASGRKGVAIMTTAGSQRSDEFKKRIKSTSRSAKGHVFQPKENKMK